MEPDLKSENSDNELILDVLDEIWQKPKGDVLVFLAGERNKRTLRNYQEAQKILRFTHFFLAYQVQSRIKFLSRMRADGLFYRPILQKLR